MGHHEPASGLDDPGNSACSARCAGGRSDQEEELAVFAVLPARRSASRATVVRGAIKSFDTGDEESRNRKVSKAVPSTEKALNHKVRKEKPESSKKTWQEWQVKIAYLGLGIGGLVIATLGVGFYRNSLLEAGYERVSLGASNEQVLRLLGAPSRIEPCGKTLARESQTALSIFIAIHSLRWCPNTFRSVSTLAGMLWTSLYTRPHKS